MSKKKKFSKHITWKEATGSATAKKLEIDNTPNEDQLNNMQNLAEDLFEPLRERVGKPILINSFFRCEDLNRAIGGSSRSQHCEGRAIDLDDTFGHKTNAEMFHYIKDNLDFDQLIWEFGDDNNPDWVHVSFISFDENRKRIMRAERVNGKTTYRYI